MRRPSRRGTTGTVLPAAVPDPAVPDARSPVPPPAVDPTLVGAAAVDATRAEALAERDAPGRWVERVGRGGLVAYGVVHVLIAVLAVRVALLGDRAHADPRGAIAIIASSGLFGRWLLGAVALALVTFALWQVRAACVGFRWVPDRGERLRKRVGALAKAGGVLSVAWLAARFAVHDAGSRNAFRVLIEQTFRQPGGRLLVLLVGVITLISAGTMVYTAVRGTFMGDLVPHRVPDRLRRATRAAGSAGNLTRAITFAVIGVLAAGAALANDPDRIGGVDVALRALAAHTLGAAALILAALGFAAYGLYCLVDARARHP